MVENTILINTRRHSKNCEHCKFKIFLIKNLVTFSKLKTTRKLRIIRILLSDLFK